MTEGTPQKFTIKKKFTQGIKLPNGELKSFTTELETDVEIDSGAKLVEAADKLFQQVRYLTELDIEKYFNSSAEGE